MAKFILALSQLFAIGGWRRDLLYDQQLPTRTCATG